MQEACAQLRKNLQPVLKAGKDARDSWLSTLAAAQPAPGGYVNANVLLSAYGWFDGTVRSGGTAPDAHCLP